MTNEEAIETLKRNYHSECFEQLREAVDMAISAIEKQIPEKPNGEHRTRMKCPSCNHRIPSGLGSSSRRRDNWCNYCGQRIDWGADE